MFKVGQKVWCKNYGEGVVSGVCSEYHDYPVVVKFLKGGWEDYTADGKLDEYDDKPSLSVIEE